MRIPVRVYLHSGNIEYGTLSYHKEGPEITTKDRVYNQSTKEPIVYSILDDSILTKNMDCRQRIRSPSNQNQ